MVPDYELFEASIAICVGFSIVATFAVIIFILRDADSEEDK